MLSGSSLHESEDWRRFRAGPWSRAEEMASPSVPRPRQSPTSMSLTAGRASAYLGSGTRAPSQGIPSAGGLGPKRQAMPHLDVLLQDQAAAEGALALCAIPAGQGE